VNTGVVGMNVDSIGKMNQLGFVGIAGSSVLGSTVSPSVCGFSFRSKLNDNHAIGVISIAHKSSDVTRCVLVNNAITQVGNGKQEQSSGEKQEDVMVSSIEGNGKTIPERTKKTKNVSVKATSKFERMRLKFGVRQSGSESERKEGSAESAGFSYADFESGLTEHETDIKVGDVRVGEVVGVEGSGHLMIDIGAKCTADCSPYELAVFKGSKLFTGEQSSKLEVGDQMEVTVFSEEDPNGQRKVSLRALHFSRSWDRMIQISDEGCCCFAEITGINRGGALVEVENLKGFLPGGHCLKPLSQDIIGQKITVKCLEANRETGKLIVSERLAAASQEKIEIGQLVEGVVNSIRPFGAFVNVGYAYGLLHISQISATRIDNMEEVFTVGEKLKMLVKNIELHEETGKTRISLSTRVLEPNPGDMLTNRESVMEQAEEMRLRFLKHREEKRRQHEEAEARLVEDTAEGLDEEMEVSVEV